MGEPFRSPQLSPQQLKEGSMYLVQVFWGLAALAQIKTGDLAATMITVATLPLSSVPNPPVGNLDLGRNIHSSASIGLHADFSKLSDRLLSLPPSNPLWQPLTAPELVFSIEVLSYLCQQHQELIRRAVSLLEQITKEGKDPWQITLLKDYNQRLAASYPPQSIALTAQESHQWRGKILLDLLFYSSAYGQSRLWLRCTQPVNLNIITPDF